MKVPSISNVAIRSSAGIKFLESLFVTSSTNSFNNLIDAQSFHNLKYSFWVLLLQEVMSNKGNTDTK